jgi:hypothetical protein
VGRQHDLDRLVEQPPQPGCDLLDRDVFRQGARGDLEPLPRSISVSPAITARIRSHQSTRSSSFTSG